MREYYTNYRKSEQIWLEKSEKSHLHTGPETNLPYWFKKQSYNTHISSYAELIEAIYTMDNSSPQIAGQLPWMTAFEPTANLEIAFNIFRNFCKRASNLGSFGSTYDLPIETLLKSNMNAFYANNAIKIIASKLENASSHPINAFELGGGSGFMAPQLIHSSPELTNYIHHDVYMPYYASQSVCCDIYSNLNPNVTHVDLSQNNLSLSQVLHDSPFSINLSAKAKSNKLNLKDYPQPQKMISLPLWKTSELLESPRPIDLFIANDCLQEMDSQQAHHWLSYASANLSHHGLCLFAGSGAPHGWYLYELLGKTNLHPLFMGRFSVPFLCKGVEIGELHLLARRDSIYFNKSNSGNHFLSKKAQLYLSRGIHGELGVDHGKFPKFSYINTECNEEVEILLGDELKTAKESGVFVDKQELSLNQYQLLFGGL